MTFKTTMTSNPLTAQDIARFLQDNPDFFTDHATVFAALKVPHPHQASAISLGERQILTLRARTRELEWQLSGLIQNATGNERISKLLIDWCASLLCENDAHRLPELIIQGLSRLFDLPDITLRLWNLSVTGGPSTFMQEVSTTVQHDTENRDQPYCGPADGHEAANWLDTPPESLALLPLTLGKPARTIGLLVLGSPDATRFTPDMGTDFLKTIATLTSAALARLAEPELPESA